jgi:hypothetical protein
MRNSLKRRLQVVQTQDQASFSPRPVLAPVKNDDGHVTSFDLGWIRASGGPAFRTGRMAPGGAR